jgi:hypothetical protein
VNSYEKEIQPDDDYRKPYDQTYDESTPVPNNHLNTVSEANRAKESMEDTNLLMGTPGEV